MPAEGRRRGNSCIKLEQLTVVLGFEDGGRGSRVKHAGGSKAGKGKETDST